MHLFLLADECKIILLELDDSESFNILKVSSFLEAAITKNTEETRHIKKESNTNLKKQKTKKDNKDLTGQTGILG